MPSSSQTLTLRNDLAELARLAEFIDTFCAPLQPSEKDRLALHLSLEEAVTNVVNHGYRDAQPHPISVTLGATGDRVTATITDESAPYDPLARPPVDTSAPLEERAVGGLGVHLMKKLMDDCHYERRGGKNILTLQRVFRRAS